MGNKAQEGMTHTAKGPAAACKTDLVASRPVARKTTLQGNCGLQDRKWPVSPIGETVRCPRELQKWSNWGRLPRSWRGQLTHGGIITRLGPQGEVPLWEERQWFWFHVRCVKRPRSKSQRGSRRPKGGWDAAQRWSTCLACTITVTKPRGCGSRRPPRTALHAGRMGSESQVRGKKMKSRPWIRPGNTKNH